MFLSLFATCALGAEILKLDAREYSGRGSSWPDTSGNGKHAHLASGPLIFLFKHFTWGASEISLTATSPGTRGHMGSSQRSVSFYREILRIFLVTFTIASVES